MSERFGSMVWRNGDRVVEREQAWRSGNQREWEVPAVEWDDDKLSRAWVIAGPCIQSETREYEPHPEGFPRVVVGHAMLGAGPVYVALRGDSAVVLYQGEHVLVECNHWPRVETRLRDLWMQKSGNKLHAYFDYCTLDRLSTLFAQFVERDGTVWWAICGQRLSDTCQEHRARSKRAVTMLGKLFNTRGVTL